MSEQDISRLIVHAVLNKDFKTKLENPETRAAALSNINGKTILQTRIDLSAEEITNLEKIDANKLETLAQACYDQGLLTRQKS